MAKAKRLRSLLREPLIHFLIAGFLLFLLLGSGGGVDPAERSITVSQQQIDRMSSNWQQTWRRPPNDDELASLIDDFVREEIYYREAMRLGLDENDTVIRRRLRSKMEFLARAEIESAQPDDAMLQDWLDDHAARYAQGAQLSFDQVYIGSDGDGTTLLSQLRNGRDPAGMGTAISLPGSMDTADNDEIARLFGQQFADALTELDGDNWQGPVVSGFGEHLVRITEREAGETPTLATIRQRVENDWRAATMEDREDEAFQILREAYTVEIEGG